jgi:glutathione S-transferase
MAQDSGITFYFLVASRTIRMAWLLEELNLPYTLVAAPRAPKWSRAARVQEENRNSNLEVAYDR